MQIFLTGTAPNMMYMILMYVAIFGAMYWFFIRPQRKKEEQVRLAQSQIEVGQTVITSSGIHGVVVDVADEVFIVEVGVNKGVCIAVRKSDVFPGQGYDL
ncbi:MAG: preprotein translocase subunit YajC [Lachnospirales bacterium]